MTQADKVEVMDFIINILKDHEKNLDTLITRAEDVIEEKQSPRESSQNPSPMIITLRDWDEFKDRALDSELVCFDFIESFFLCEAIIRNKIFLYKEKTSESEFSQISNHKNIKKILSSEMNITPNHVVNGTILDRDLLDSLFQLNS